MKRLYLPAVQAGWEALKAAVQPNGLLGWVQPVGAGPTATTAMTTDVFGVGAYLLAGSEMQKYAQRKDPRPLNILKPIRLRIYCCRSGQMAQRTVLLLW